MTREEAIKLIDGLTEEEKKLFMTYLIALLDDPKKAEEIERETGCKRERAK